MQIAAAVQRCAYALLLQYFTVHIASRTKLGKSVDLARYDSDVASRLATLLLDHGLIEVQVDDAFQLTAAANESLSVHGSSSVANMITHEWHQQVLWADIDSTLRGHLTEHQQDTVLKTNPKRLQLLLNAILEVDPSLISVLVGLPWPIDATIWDVAGGHGVLLGEVIRANRGSVSGIVVDLPGAKPLVEEAAARLNVQLGFRAADVTALDFLNSSGHGNGIVLLSRCLHNFSPQFQRALVSYGMRITQGPIGVVIANPSWDWTEGTPYNPRVALFSLYMAVNAIGGGVRPRSEFQRELAGMGASSSSAISETLDLYIVGRDDAEVNRWIRTLPLPAARPVVTRDFEAEADRFIPAAVIMASIKWELPRFLSKGRTLYEVEKFLGLSPEVTFNILAGLGGLGLVERSRDDRYVWACDTAIPDERDIKLLKSLAATWSFIADAGDSGELEVAQLSELLRLAGY